VYLCNNPSPFSCICYARVAGQACQATGHQTVTDNSFSLYACLSMQSPHNVQAFCSPLHSRGCATNHLVGGGGTRCHFRQGGRGRTAVSRSSNGLQSHFLTGGEGVQWFSASPPPVRWFVAHPQHLTPAPHTSPLFPTVTVTVLRSEGDKRNQRRVGTEVCTPLRSPGRSSRWVCLH